MLQSSQIEKPRCSAKIDQMRLRRAMNLPFEFQNFSSSGFQSEIQAGLSLLISVFLSVSGSAPHRGRHAGFCFARRVPIYLTEKSWISAIRRLNFARFAGCRDLILCTAKLLGGAIPIHEHAALITRTKDISDRGRALPLSSEVSERTR